MCGVNGCSSLTFCKRCGSDSSAEYKVNALMFVMQNASKLYNINI